LKHGSMTDEIKVSDAGTADNLKLAAAIVIVVAGVGGYYLLASQPSWMRWLPVIGSLLLAAVVVAFSRYGTEFRRFVELARIELRKIVWPTRQETLQTTLVVFGFVIVAGLFFWLLDLVLAWATKALTGTGG
jgi:preprotein translocase subunit SecE